MSKKRARRSELQVRVERASLPEALDGAFHPCDGLPLREVRAPQVQGEGKAAEQACLQDGVDRKVAVREAGSPRRSRDSPVEKRGRDVAHERDEEVGVPERSPPAKPTHGRGSRRGGLEIGAG